MSDIDNAVQVIKQGGIVIFPTDTAYGIGCRMDNPGAVERLFEIRKRPKSQATPVLFDNLSRIEEFVLPIEHVVVDELIKKYWPGALTIILKAKTDRVPALVRGGTDTLGVRIPDSDLVRNLVSKVGAPILGPSANFHGEETPFNFKDLDQDLVKLVDFVIEGEVKLKKASTVIDCTQKPWKILRLGSVEIKL